MPGDVLAGAAAARTPWHPRVLGATASSVCMYWAGMALNDYADATVDAVERPDRPVPSGRVPRRTALAVATGLTAASLGLAAATGGRRGLLGALPLTALVWSYDLGLKSTPAGPAVMAGARAADVLIGALAVAPPGAAASALRRGTLPAALMAAHTYTLTALSRHEIAGAPAGVPARTLAASTATALATAAGPLVRGLRGSGTAADADGGTALRGIAGGAARPAARAVPPTVAGAGGTASRPASRFARQPIAGPARSGVRSAGAPAGRGSALASVASAAGGASALASVSAAGRASALASTASAGRASALASMASAAGGASAPASGTATAARATVLAAALRGTRPQDPRTAATALIAGAAALAYLGSYGLAQVKAVRAPSGENVRGAVGAGITALVPLQAALTARAGAPVAAALLGAVHPLARRLARRISPT
ncbi:UbiA family prenyltransferase [Streptomyces niveiscabiei]|uniref:UbiA family prenyltransferase n=1 Tax=Streptomyces niveiscabiei TaxID=164115 RepID=UPI0029B7D1BD|nr:UbiA family prenyltransferase [Streptomyces niveiscabiei]MDX3380812.1 UbiA family prenyltransferase [Streptomyces niveiscabiei]